MKRWTIYTHTYTVLPVIDSALGVCSSPLDREWSLVAELGENALEVYSVPPGLRTPKSCTNLAPMPSAGISKGWNMPGLLSLFVNLSCWLQWSFRISGSPFLIVPRCFCILALGEGS